MTPSMQPSGILPASVINLRHERFETEPWVELGFVGFDRLEDDVFGFGGRLLDVELFRPRCIAVIGDRFDLRYKILCEFNSNERPRVVESETTG